MNNIKYDFLKLYFCAFLMMFVLSFTTVQAQKTLSDTPMFGAQIFIEPGQTEAEIDTWFLRLKESGMKTARIRMFESYMHKSAGIWDFSLFDMAFKAAEKYDIKVYATLFPYTEKTDIGGFKFPRDEEHLQSISRFIEKLITHFSKFKSLYGWVLINEPGVGGKVPETEFIMNKNSVWLKNNPPKEFTDNGYPVLVELTDQRFLMYLNTWYLNWIADEIKKYDNAHIIHVNNHAIFQNCAEYDFPSWHKFLTTLGGSAHAGWHFGYFKRNQYALAMSANSEIVRSGAGELPWIMTEIQGGNNTYSAMAPLCPTKEEIAQWMWIIIGTQGKGGIFWSLNPRSSGIEAGEWAMLDFQDKPSDRLTAATEVIKVIDSKPGLFANAREVESGINLLYFRESLWAEKKMASPSSPRYEGREEGAVMKSLLAYFETFSELGINSNIKEFGEFNFSGDNFTGQVIVLANQIAIPSGCVADLEKFVSKGGKLIVDGLTGFFDENLHNTMKTGFSMERLLGGNISEFKVVDNLFDLKIGENDLPAHLWRGYIDKKSGQVISSDNGTPVALRNFSENGVTLWIPSLIGLGAWIDDNSELAKFLKTELKTNFERSPFSFTGQQKGTLMKTLQSGNSYITILINKTAETKNIELQVANQKLKPEIIYADKSEFVIANSVHISPEETVVILWKQN